MKRDAVSDLWVDTPDALDLVRAKAGGIDWMEIALRNFIEKGYAIIPDAVSDGAIDRYREDLERVVRNRGGLKASFVHGIHPLEELDATKPLTKILDTFVLVPSALKLVFAEKIRRFLTSIFSDHLLAFQGLHFEVGSTQAIHQDTSYVVVDRPFNLAASWVALEDVQEGSGELVYYPGSHRFPLYLYGGRRLPWPFGRQRLNWKPARDGNEIHNRHLAMLREQAQARGIERETFMPRKGDALIWHAYLAHGGGPITAKSLTRRSLVSHYCPLHNTPRYFASIPSANRLKVPVGNGDAISSMYYPPRSGLAANLAADAAF
ncbi:MAG: phytanoyl-CoA dioxygenase family protein [Bauldia sp.]|nr:phytanoyl-CoA dioxygenase family protein [Bauldia sp.]